MKLFPQILILNSSREVLDDRLERDFPRGRCTFVIHVNLAAKSETSAV
jgi:hypothetical protein